MKNLIIIIMITLVATGLSYKFHTPKTVKYECVPDTVHIKTLIPQTSNNKEVWQNSIDFFVSGENIKRSEHFYKTYGIPPSVYLAHSALESGFGSSKLVKRTKNRGNIKTKKGGIKAFDKIEKSNDSYKIFPSFYEGEKAIMKLLVRYKDIKKVRNSFYYKDWTKALEDSPYSTDVKYEEKLNSIIEKFQLYNIDRAILRGDVIINFSLIPLNV